MQFVSWSGCGYDDGFGLFFVFVAYRCVCSCGGYGYDVTDVFGGVVFVGGIVFLPSLISPMCWLAVV